ncbi:MAG: hypothetical protein AAF211_26780, partial [Myxococcota bacterium]
MIGWVMWTVALAQDPIATGSVQQLHASVDSQRTLWVDDAGVSRSGTGQVRALGSFTAGPLITDGDVTVVGSAWQGDVAAAFTAGRARVGLTLPVLGGVASEVAGVPSAGLSDVGLDVKYAIRDPDVAPLGIAAKARIGVPVFDAGVTGLASEGPSLEALLLLDGAVGPVH